MNAAHFVLCYVFRENEPDRRIREYRTPFPPLIGDLIWIAERDHRVVERAWTYSEKGSPNWPNNREQPINGPLLYVFVRPEPPEA